MVVADCEGGYSGPSARSLMARGQVVFCIPMMNANDLIFSIDGPSRVTAELHEKDKGLKNHIDQAVNHSIHCVELQRLRDPADAKSGHQALEAVLPCSAWLANKGQPCRKQRRLPSL